LPPYGLTGLMHVKPHQRQGDLPSPHRHDRDSWHGAQPGTSSAEKLALLASLASTPAPEPAEG
jgi:hypothetical protein